MSVADSGVVSLKGLKMSSSILHAPAAAAASASHSSSGHSSERPVTIGRTGSVAVPRAAPTGQAEMDSKSWSKHMENLANASRNATAAQQHRKSALVHANARIDELLQEINDPLMNKAQGVDDFSEGGQPNDGSRLSLPKTKGRSRRPSVSVTDWRPFAPRKDVVSGSVEVIRPTPLKRSETLREVKVRQDNISAHIGHVMNHPIYMWISILLCFYSLFIHDISTCSFPPSSDSGISNSLLVIFILFSLEILVNCVIKQYYLFGFNFWLDIVGTFSLIFDISLIYDSMFPTNSSQRGVNGQMNRTTAALQITRLARLFRVLRIIRVVRIFKFHQSINVLVNNSQNPNKPQYDDASYGIEMALLAIAGAATAPVRDNLVKSLLTFHPECFYLTSNGVTYIDQRAQNTGLRSSETDTYTFGSTMAIFSVRDGQYQAAVNSIILTILIILIFLIGSLIISRDVHELVVAPLERMQVIIRRLAGTVCFLSAATEADEQEANEGFETNLIEAIIEKMAHIFSVQPESDGSAPKPVQMMAGSKLTEIQTASSVVSIEVVERPRILDMDETEIQKSLQDDGMNSIHVPLDPNINQLALNPSNYVEPNPAVHKEITSIDTILSFSPIIPHFKLYLQANLLVENLLFFQEVDRYRVIMRHHALNLYSAFLSNRAVNPIPLSMHQLETVRQELDDPGVDSFNLAESEVLHIMAGHLSSFLQSKFCQAYLRNRKMVKSPSRFSSGKTQTLSKAAQSKDSHERAPSTEPLETPGQIIRPPSQTSERDAPVALATPDGSIELAALPGSVPEDDGERAMTSP